MSRMTSKFLVWSTGLVEVALDKMKKAKGRTDNRIWEPNAEFTFGHHKHEISMEKKTIYEIQMCLTCFWIPILCQLWSLWISNIYNYNLLSIALLTSKVALNLSPSLMAVNNNNILTGKKWVASRSL